MEEQYKQLQEMFNLLEASIKAARADVEYNYKNKVYSAFTPDSLAFFFSAMTYSIIAPLKGYADRMKVSNLKVLAGVARIANDIKVARASAIFNPSSQES